MKLYERDFSTLTADGQNKGVRPTLVQNNFPHSRILDSISPERLIPMGFLEAPKGFGSHEFMLFATAPFVCSSSVWVFDSICTGRRPRFTTRTRHLGFQWVTGKKMLVKSCLGQQWVRPLNLTRCPQSARRDVSPFRKGCYADTHKHC